MKDCVHKKQYLTFRQYINIIKIQVVTTLFGQFLCSYHFYDIKIAHVYMGVITEIFMLKSINATTLFYQKRSVGIKIRLKKKYKKLINGNLSQNAPNIK